MAFRYEGYYYIDCDTSETKMPYARTLHVANVRRVLRTLNRKTNQDGAVFGTKITLNINKNNVTIKKYASGNTVPRLKMTKGKPPHVIRLSDYCGIILIVNDVVQIGITISPVRTQATSGHHVMDFAIGNGSLTVGVLSINICTLFCSAMGPTTSHF